MAVKTYLQTAISQVQTAMADMESQVHGMHQNADSRKNQLQTTCANLERECTLHLAEIGHLQDASQKHILEQRMGGIKHQIEGYKAQMAQIDSEVASIQQRKDALHRNLYNAVGELRRLMSLPDIG